METKHYPLIIGATIFAAGWYAAGAIRCAFGAGKAVAKGRYGRNKVYAESQR